MAACRRSHWEKILGVWPSCLAALLIAFAFSAAGAASLAVKPAVDQKPAALAPDDVSWLFPPPRTVKDLDNTIAIADLLSIDPSDPEKRQPILPEATFKQFVAIVESDDTKIGDHRVFLPADAHNLKNWRVAGIRIDPGAPGLSPAVIGQFGQTPQLRFILQPITVHPDGFVEIHDVAAHLIYNFVPGGLKGVALPAAFGCLPRAVPEIDAFHDLARDFRGLRDQLAAGAFGGQAVSTSGTLLGVHPGLANAATAKPLRDALVRVLEKHLSSKRFGGLAIMGLADHGPEPWVFLATARLVPHIDQLFAVRGPALDGRQLAQALAVKDTPHQVAPTPATNNLNPITCKNAGLLFGAELLPVSARKGVSTAELFDLGDKELTDPKAKARVKEVVDVIADPTRSHFFNTDCVSCHTDTRRTLDLLGSGAQIPGVDPAALPGNKWNVRNFGWSLSKPADPTKPGDKSVEAASTATRRAASETRAVVDYVNSHGLAN